METEKKWDMETCWNSWNTLIPQKIEHTLEAPPYLLIDKLIDMIDEPNRSQCVRLFTDNKELFKKAKWSNVKHQAREWGYINHLEEVMNVAVIMYQDLHRCRKLPFSLSDALLILFIHDLEKPRKYAWSQNDQEELTQYADAKDFIKMKMNTYAFQLSEEHRNAFTYIHGEWKDYNPNQNIQWPLGAFAHCCDTISARIWFNHPISWRWW